MSSGIGETMDKKTIKKLIKICYMALNDLEELDCIRANEEAHSLQDDNPVESIKPMEKAIKILESEL
jgi:hypothetical protein